MYSAFTNGDALIELKKYADKSADVAITSPPYNMNLRIRKGKHCSRQLVKELTTKYENYDDNLSMDDYYKFNVSIIDELLRISSLVFYNVQILTGNKEALYRLIGHYSKNIKELIVWDKKTAQPAIGNGVLNSQFELLLVLSDAEDAISRAFTPTYFKRGTLSNLWAIPKGKKVCKEHKAVFPEALVERIITNFTCEGAVVLDPFMGTGTTGAVCKRLNRNFVGVELDSAYYNFALQRIGMANKGK